MGTFQNQDCYRIFNTKIFPSDIIKACDKNSTEQRTSPTKVGFTEHIGPKAPYQNQDSIRLNACMAPLITSLLT